MSNGILVDWVRLPDMGFCIYCGDTSQPLAVEHIIPYFLDGKIELPSASCKACERITGKYEGVVARGMFAEFRAKHNIQTRRPKERPKSFPITTSTGAQLNVPVRDMPNRLFMFKFGQPGILAGVPENTIPLKAEVHPVSFREELNAFIASHQWDGKVRVRGDFIEFARMLAKIAHSFAYGFYQPNILKPTALDVVLAKTTDVFHVVGGSLDIPPPVPSGGHLLSLGYHLDHQRRRHFLTVSIRLFSNWPMPKYLVVVGEANNARDIVDVCKQVDDGNAEKALLPFVDIVPRGLN